MLELLQSRLWYNDTYLAVFTKHKTPNLKEYHWFTSEVKTGIRQHRSYKLIDNSIIINLDGILYSIKELSRMAKYDLIMIQISNVSDPMDYINWMSRECQQL